MTNSSILHSECGRELSLWADLIYSETCGHIPIHLTSETEITDFLPCLIEADIIAKTDFQGIALNQI